MRTFEDAIRIFIKDHTADKKEEDNFVRLFEGYTPIMREVQESEKTMILAYSLVNFGMDKDLCPHIVVAMAISHGVAIGMEMEKGEFSEPTR